MKYLLSSTKIRNSFVFMCICGITACKYKALEEQTSASFNTNTVIENLLLPQCDGECSCDEIVNPFNDTGVSIAGDFPEGNFQNCNNQSDFFQDCDVGKDTNQSVTHDGHLGFRFSKLDSNGQVVAQIETASCVLDNNTGLIWEVKAPANSGLLQDSEYSYTYTNLQLTAYNSAQQGQCEADCTTEKYIEKINALALCGFSDWRLPNKVELQDLLNYNQSQPAIDTDFFPNTKSSFYWTSSLDVDDSGSVWAVDFNVGRVAGGKVSDPRYIRLVRGDALVHGSSLPVLAQEQVSERRRLNAPQQRCNDIEAFSSPVSRYKQDNEGHVLDTLTGLIWQRCIAGLSGDDCQQGVAEKLNWQQAFNYAKQLNDVTPQARPWRLPSVKELQQNIEMACEEPPLNPFAFPNIPFGEVWSSTPNSRNADTSYQYQYQNSIIFYSPRTTQHYVHLVRDCKAI